MDDAAVTVVSLSLVLGVIFSLSHPSFRMIGNAVSMILFAASVLVPIASIITGIVELPSISPELPSDDLFGEYTLEAYTEAVEEYLADEFRLSASDITVSGSGLELERMRLQEIKVTLSGGAVLADTSRMRSALLNEFVLEGGSCYVLLDFG